MRLEQTPAGGVCIRWCVSAEEWASLDAEFPAAVGATHPILRLRLVRRNGTVQEIATQDLDSAGATREGELEIPLRVSGNYEAELGLASDDGGWLVLGRSERRHCAGFAPDEPPAERDAGGDDQGGLSLASTAATAAGAPKAQRPHDAATSNPAIPEFWGLTSADHEDASPHTTKPHTAQASAADPPSALEATPGRASEPQPRAFGQGPAAAGYQARPDTGDAVEVRAELVVYGRAPPGARLDLYGRTLQVGPGGAFSLHFPVTDSDLLRRVLSEAASGGADDPPRSDPNQR